MIGEIVSDMHGMEQGQRRGGGRRMPHAAAPRAKALVQCRRALRAPVQCRRVLRVETQDPGVGGEAQGRAASYLHSHPTRRRQGRRSECCARGGGGSDRRETYKSRAPFNPTGFGLSFFF